MEEPKVFTHTDDEGNEIEVIAKGDLEALQTSQQEELEAEKLKNEELAKQLEGEKDKDKNFANLRKKKEESDSALGEVNDRLASLEEMLSTRNEQDTKVVESTKDSLLVQIAGDDKDLQEAVKLQYNKFEGDPTLPAEIQERMEDALAIVHRKSNTQGDNPITRAASASGNPSFSPKKSDSFSDTDDGKKFADSLGLKLSNDDK